MSQVLSQTFSQSQKPACIQCGGTEYVLESGHYFCADCQVQSQDIREEVFDEYAGGQRGIKLAIPSLKSQELPLAEVSTAAEQPEFTSWEALNIILHGLVNELILLGAPSDLKTVALQLWARYLNKIEAAFTSKSIERRPRLGLTFRKRDAQLVYGIDNEVANTQKRPVYRPKRERSPSLSGNESSKSAEQSRRIEKYRLTMKKKKLASAEYAASTSASSQGSELTLENLSALSPGVSPQKTPKVSKLHYSKKAKEALLELLENAALVEDFDRGYLQNKYLRRHSNDLDHPTIAKLLVILRLSLLILDSNIHLSDLLRWSDEGYLSLLNAEKLIPHGIILTKDIKSIFVTTLKSRTTINAGVMKMANALKITDLKSRILPLIQRYLREFCLPDEIFDIIKRLIALKPPSSKLTITVNYEARALGFIIFVLKFLFGLDGVTEKVISRFASSVNRDLKDSQKLFSWTEWVHFINCRNSFLSVYHQVSRDFYYPTSKYGGFNAFLSHWEKIPAKQTLTRQHIIDSDLADCMRRVLKGLCHEPVEPLAPSLEPVSTMLKTLLQHKQNIPNRAKSILQHDFSLDSIQYLTDLNRQEELCRKYGAITTPHLAAKFVQVKPVPADPKVYLFTRRKKKCRVKFVGENPEHVANLKLRDMDNKRGVLPDSEEIQRGVILKSKYKYTENKLTLPVLGRQYWIYHGGCISRVKTDMAKFDCLAESIFPPDFLWLLKEAAHIGHVYPKDVYIQLKEVERIYLRFLGLGKKDQTFQKW